jgi:hypothetical protein
MTLMSLKLLGGKLRCSSTTNEKGLFQQTKQENYRPTTLFALTSVIFILDYLLNSLVSFMTEVIHIVSNEQDDIISGIVR